MDTLTQQSNRLPPELFSLIASLCHPQSARALKCLNSRFSVLISPTVLSLSDMRWILERSTPRECLFWAVHNGHIAVVSYLISNGIPMVDRCDALLRAVSRNQHKVVTLLLENGASVNFLEERAEEYRKQQGAPPPPAAPGGWVGAMSWAGIWGWDPYDDDDDDSEGLDEDYEVDGNEGGDLTVLSAAARVGNVLMVGLLLNAGADIHAFNDVALSEAAGEGHSEVVSMLIEAGADLHSENDFALSLACMEGHVEVVRRLLAAGADVRATEHEDVWENSALVAAVVGGHHDLIPMLLDAGGDVRGHPNIIFPPVQSGDIEMVRMLLEAGASVNAQSPHLQWRRVSALEEAASQGHAEIVSLLLSAGAVSDEAFHWAAGHGHLDVMAILLAANQHAVPRAHTLYAAITSGYSEVLEMLLKEWDIGEELGTDALRLAARSGQPASVSVLLKSGVSLPTELRNHPFMLAVKSGNAEIVKMLIDAGADPNMTDGADPPFYPIFAAITRHHSHIVKLLLDEGAILHTSNRKINLLHIAVAREDYECVKILLENNIDPNVVDGRGEHILSRARRGRDQRIVSLLVDAGSKVDERQEWLGRLRKRKQ